MKLNQYPSSVLWNIKEIYSFHWYNTSFQFQVKPFLAGHAEFVLCILLASPAFVLQAGGRGEKCSKFSLNNNSLWRHKLCLQFSLCMSSCCLSAPFCSALPNTSLPPYSRTLLLEWLKSPALCKKFGLQPLFGTRKQSSRVVWQQVWPPRRLTKWLTDWKTDWLTQWGAASGWARAGFSLAAFGASL